MKTKYIHLKFRKPFLAFQLFIVLNFWVVLHTSAQTWTAQTSGTSYALYGVSFSDANTGTAVGNTGTIVSTTNAGSTWSSQSSGLSDNLIGVSFVSSTTGNAVGATSTVLRTTNGGTNWTNQASTSGWLNSVSFTDANTGNAAGFSGKVFRTTNGGSTWTYQTISGLSSYNLNGISFSGSNNGIVVGDGGKIAYTSNGGSTWTVASSGVTVALYSVCLVGSTGYVVGAISGGTYSTILKTTDGGASWTDISVSNGAYAFYGLCFTDANNGTLVGYNGIIIRTTNGGTSWSTQRSPSGSYPSLRAVSFVDANHGTAVGDGGTILRTDDGAGPSIWDGGASTNNWGDANNWSPDGIPSSSTTVNLTGANTININVAATCNNITLNNASLVLTIQSGYSLTVSGNLTLTTGTLNTENAFPSVTGTTTLTAGTIGYSASSGSQSVLVKSYVNLTISGGGTKTLAGTITPSGNLTISGGTFDLGIYTAHRYSAGGTLTISNGATLKIGSNNNFPSNYSTHSIGASSTVEYGGSDQFVNVLNSSQNYGNLTISGSGTKSLLGATVVTGNLTISGGTLSTNSSYSMTIGGNWSNSGTFSSSAGTVTFNASSGTQTLNSGSSQFFNLTHNTASTLQLTSNGLSIFNTFTNSTGTFDANGQTATFAKLVTLSSGTYLASTATQTFTEGLTVSGGTFTGGSGNVDMNGAFTISSGTFTAPSGNMYVSHNWVHTAGGTFTHNSGTVVLDAVTYRSIDVNTSETFYNLTLNYSAGINPNFSTGDVFKTVGTLALISGFFTGSTCTLEAQGDVTVGASYYTNNNVPLLFSGAATQSFDLTGATDVFNASITVNKTGGAVNLASALVIDATSQSLTITAGTFDLSGNNLTAPGSGGTFSVASGGNLQLQGGETISSTPTLSTGSTVTYDGTSASYTLKNYSTYKNLAISGGASTQFILPADLSVAGTLTLTAGYLTLGTYNLTMASGSTLSGGSSSSFVYTGITGAFKWASCAASSTKTFPVGHTNSSAGYTPLVITFNVGHTTDDFGVVAYNLVTSDGTRIGTAYTTAVVKTTWNITETVSGGSNINLQFQWNATDEGSTFNRASCQMSHYTASTWGNVGSLGSASGSNPYTFTYSNYTGTFSPFGMNGSGGPLPVTLLFFKTEKENNLGLLTWATASEKDNDYFTIEKSLDGKSYKAIGKLVGAGNSQQILKYDFTDSNLVNGLNYYRLKQTDYDGKFSYSPVALISNNTERKDNNILTLYPVPANDHINIDMNSPLDIETHLRILTVFGKTVLEKNISLVKGQNHIEIDLNELSSGVYFIQFIGQQTFKSARFSINK